MSLYHVQLIFFTLVSLTCQCNEKLLHMSLLYLYAYARKKSSTEFAMKYNLE
jgi:hypothetical protein